MSDARAEILANLRRALRAGEADAPRRASVEARLSAHPAGVIPARGQKDGEALIDLFIAQAQEARASLARVAERKDVPGAVDTWLRDNAIPGAVRLGADPIFASMPFEQTPLEITRGPSRGDDLTALSHALAGVAETATLVLASGPDNPTTLNFLPENHIVVVERGEIVGAYEEAFERLRALFGAGRMPRALNFVTGPSRSADIEQKLQLGAHGPRNLHIILVG